MANKTQMVTQEASSLQAVPPTSSSTTDSTAIIQVIERAALNPDVDIDKMERLLQMQERVMDRQAMMAYSAAMAAMQTELPSIEERGQTNNGCYATLEDIVDTVRPILQKTRLRSELPYSDPGTRYPSDGRADAQGRPSGRDQHAIACGYER